MMDGQANYRADEALVEAGADATDEGRAFETFVAEGGQATLDGMIQLIIASPQSAPLVLDVLDKARDWPMAAVIAQQIRAMLEPKTPAEQEQATEHLAVPERARPAEEAPTPTDPVREAVVAADAAATLAGLAAGRQVRAEAYESHRIVAMAAVETMIAHAQLALAALRWESENVPVIAGYLIHAERQIRIASHAVGARMELADVEECLRASRGEAAPSAA